MIKKIIATALSSAILFTALNPCTVISAFAYNESSTSQANDNPTYEFSYSIGVNEIIFLNEIIPDKISELGNIISYNNDNENAVLFDSSENTVTGLNSGKSTITFFGENGVSLAVNVSVYNGVSSIRLNFTKKTLLTKQKFTLESKFNSNENTFRLLYSSSNPNVASVDATSGVVTALNDGTAIITAKAYNGVFAQCKVTVRKAPYSLSLTPKNIIINVGERYRFTAKIPENTYSTIAFYSSNNNILKVAKDGTIKGLKAGTAYVIAKTENGLTQKSKVIVKKAPSKIKFKSKIITLKKGKKTTLKYTIPKGSYTKKITFKSLNPSIVKVNEKTGKAYAKKSGVAVIKVKTANGKTDYCKIAVPKQWNVKTINSCSLKEQSKWAGKTLTKVKKGAKVNIISRNSRWYKIVYKNKIGYIYNKSIKKVSNYSKVNNKTFSAVIDDWIYKNGTGLRKIFNVCCFSYSPMPKRNFTTMCVTAWKYKTGSCYYHASLLSYMLKKAGYNAQYVEGYSKTGPHAWVAVKTGGHWKMIDSTPNRRHGLYYLVPYSKMSKFGYTILPQYKKYTK